MKRRVLVTGSRTWTNGQLVEAILGMELRSIGVRDDMVVVHGAAVGADSFAQSWVDWAAEYDPRISADPHPANWKYSGRGAGLLRNQHMVDLGAHVCYAFIHNGSRGATDCAARAEAAGIRTIRVLA